MNTEAAFGAARADDVESRARLHAALAEPARLRIVDLLSLGDASPSELQARLGIPSNLLAHHLRTLETVGLVLRHRSQADRRRSYLQLVPDPLDGLPHEGIAPTSVPRIVFVCTANSARSQLATALWRDASPAHQPRLPRRQGLRHCRRHQGELLPRRPRH